MGSNPYFDIDPPDAPAAAPVATVAPAAPVQSSAKNPYFEIDPPEHAAAAPEGDQPGTWGDIGMQALKAVPRAGMSLLDFAQAGIDPARGMADIITQRMGVPTRETPKQLIEGVLPDKYNPDSAQNAPKNRGERLTDAVVQGAVTGLIAPGGGLLAKAASAAKGAFGNFSGAALQEVVPEEYKGVAGLAGNILGGGLAEAPEALLKGGNKMLNLTAAQKDRAALDLLYKNADNPSALREFANKPADAQGPAGFSGTLAQETSDTGLNKYETAVSRTDEAAPAFTKKRVEQARAQNDALTGLQATGDPADVGQFFRSQLDDIDQQHAKAVETAAQTGQKAVEATKAAGERAVEGVARSGQNALESATDRARQAAEGLGGASHPEEIGAAKRAAIQANIDDLSAHARAMWSAAPKDLLVRSNALKSAESGVYGNLVPEELNTLSSAENDIRKFIGGYGDTMPLRNLNGLRVLINKGLREASSPLEPNAPAAARLGQMRGAYEKVLDDSLTKRAAQEQQAVATGAMKPEDTMMARMQEKANEWVAAKKSGAGASAATGNGATGFNGSGPIPPRPGTNGSGGGQSSGSSGGEGVQGADGPQFATKADADALRAAVAATKAKKEVETNPLVASIMQKEGFKSGPFKMKDAAVPGKIWRSGPEGVETTKQFLDAANNSSAAVAALTEAAANSLRSRFKDGILTDKLFETWRGQHADALRTLEKAAPGSTDRFATAAKAGKTVADIAEANASRLKQTTVDADTNLKTSTKAAADTVAKAKIAHKEAVDGYAKSELAGVLKADSAENVTKTVGAAIGNVDKMRAIVRAASKNPAAMDGLRKAVADHILNEFIGNTDIGASGVKGLKADKFQSFMKDASKRASLKEVFTPEQMDHLDRVNHSLEVMKRSDATLAVKGSPTAQIASGMGKHGTGSVWHMLVNGLGSHATALTGTTAGAISGGWLGALVFGGGGQLIDALRSAGYSRVHEIVRDAMVNPEVFRALNARVPQTQGALIIFRNRLARAALIGNLAGNPDRSDKRAARQ